jgi:hypothetical protein
MQIAGTEITPAISAMPDRQTSKRNTLVLKTSVCNRDDPARWQLFDQVESCNAGDYPIYFTYYCEAF